MDDDYDYESYDDDCDYYDHEHQDNHLSENYDDQFYPDDHPNEQTYSYHGKHYSPPRVEFRQSYENPHNNEETQHQHMDNDYYNQSNEQSEHQNEQSQDTSDQTDKCEQPICPDEFKLNTEYREYDHSPELPTNGAQKYENQSEEEPDDDQSDEDKPESNEPNEPIENEPETDVDSDESVEDEFEAIEAEEADRSDLDESCIFCDSWKHTLFDCRFTDKSEKRLAFAKFGWCKVCGSKEHFTPECREFGECSFCSRRHDHAICPNNLPPEVNAIHASPETHPKPSKAQNTNYLFPSVPLISPIYFPKTIGEKNNQQHTKCSISSIESSQKRMKEFELMLDNFCKSIQLKDATPTPSKDAPATSSMSSEDTKETSKLQPTIDGINGNLSTQNLDTTTTPLTTKPHENIVEDSSLPIGFDLNNITYANLEENTSFVFMELNSDVLPALLVTNSEANFIPEKIAQMIAPVRKLMKQPITIKTSNNENIIVRHYIQSMIQIGFITRKMNFTIYGHNRILLGSKAINQFKITTSDNRIYQKKGIFQIELPFNYSINKNDNINDDKKQTDDSLSSSECEYEQPTQN